MYQRQQKWYISFNYFPNIEYNLATYPTCPIEEFPQTSVANFDSYVTNNGGRTKKRLAASINQLTSGSLKGIKNNFALLTSLINV